MIDGIGGVFLFSSDVKRLAAWYRKCLGIAAEGADSECNSVYTTFEHRDLENPEIKRTVAWAILPTGQDTKEKPRPGKMNYLVRDLGKVLSHLKSNGVAVEKTEECPYGKFAWLKDPDGNEIELWEPSKDE